MSFVFLILCFCFDFLFVRTYFICIENKLLMIDG